MKNQPAAQAEITGSGMLSNGMSFYLVASATEAGRSHVVALQGSRMHCDCTGFGYRGTCRHVKAVEAYIAAEQAVERAERKAATHAAEAARRDSAMLRRSNQPFSMMRH